jgi:hypothetical protein
MSVSDATNLGTPSPSTLSPNAVAALGVYQQLSSPNRGAFRSLEVKRLIRERASSLSQLTETIHPLRVSLQFPEPQYPATLPPDISGPENL